MVINLLKKEKDLFIPCFPPFFLLYSCHDPRGSLRLRYELDGPDRPYIRKEPTRDDYAPIKHLARSVLEGGSLLRD